MGNGAPAGVAGGAGMEGPATAAVPLNSCAFSRDGMLIFAAGNGGKVFVWLWDLSALIRRSAAPEEELTAAPQAGGKGHGQPAWRQDPAALAQAGAAVAYSSGHHPPASHSLARQGAASAGPVEVAPPPDGASALADHACNGTAAAATAPGGREAANGHHAPAAGRAVEEAAAAAAAVAAAPGHGGVVAGAAAAEGVGPAGRGGGARRAPVLVRVKVGRRGPGSLEDVLHGEWPPAEELALLVRNMLLLCTLTCRIQRNRRAGK